MKIDFEKKKSAILWIFVLSLFIGLIFSQLIRKGMYFDGMTYCAIAKNLSDGFGTMWKPHYTATVYNEFYEHPPIVFWLGAMLYKVLGTSVIVDKIFVLITAILTMIGIIMLWKEVAPINYKKNSQAPLFLWITTPIAFWSYRNNMLENTLTFFALFAVLFYIKATKESSYIKMILGTIFLTGAFLAKGPVGLFPLIVPGVYLIIHKRKFYIKEAIMTILPFALFGLIMVLITLLDKDAANYFVSYFNQQVLASLEGKRGTPGWRQVDILVRLFEEILPMILFIVILMIGYFKKKKGFKGIPLKEALFFFIIGVAASFPIALSPKQKGFYLVPSIPFYALSGGIIVIFFAKEIFAKIKETTLNKILLLNIFILAAVIIFTITQIGTCARDEEVIENVAKINKKVPEGTIIKTDDESAVEWIIVSYLARFGKISLYYGDEKKEYMLIREGKKVGCEDDYEEIKANLKNYRLYKIKK